MTPVCISLETFAGDLETYLDGIGENELVLTKDGKPAYVFIGQKRAAAWFNVVLDMVANEAIEAAGHDDDGEGQEIENSGEPETNATANNGNGENG